ncbi:MAG: TRAP transporter substrate-binding protein DctP [Nitratireductor sp.]
MRIATIAAACAALFATGAAAETLRFADSLPADHFFTEQASKYWMNLVEEETDGAVDFEHYPAQQLGKAKDMLGLVQTQTVDIAYVVPSYVSDKLPLSSVAELPGQFATSCEGTLAYWQLATGDGFLAESDYRRAGVRVLFAVVMPPYQIFLREPLGSVADLKGRKLRTSSPGQDAISEALGAVPVRITAPELYDALARGTVDGMVFPTASALAYDVAGLAKSVTRGENFGTAVLSVMISEERWQRLPENVRAVMTRAGEETTRHICRFADDSTASDFEEIAAQGTAIADLSADKADIRRKSASVAETWVVDMDKRGLAGARTFEAFQEALR